MYKKIIISLLLFNIAYGFQTSTINCVRYAINMSDINKLNNNTNKCCYNNIVKKECYDLINFNKFLYYKNYCNYYENNQIYTSIIFKFLIWVLISLFLYKI